MPGANICFDNSINLIVEEGVCGAGLITTVFPAARAGPIFQMAMMNGKFHGEIEPITPTGFLTKRDV